MKKFTKDWWADHSATVAGILVALGSAWSTIDWKEFDITKEWPHLLITAAIALGGYLSQFKLKNKEEDGTN